MQAEGWGGVGWGAVGRGGGVWRWLANARQRVEGVRGRGRAAPVAHNPPRGRPPPPNPVPPHLPGSHVLPHTPAPAPAPPHATDSPHRPCLTACLPRRSLPLSGPPACAPFLAPALLRPAALKPLAMPHPQTYAYPLAVKLLQVGGHGGHARGSAMAQRRWQLRPPTSRIPHLAPALLHLPLRVVSPSCCAPRLHLRPLLPLNVAITQHAMTHETAPPPRTRHTNLPDPPPTPLTGPAQLVITLLSIALFGCVMYGSWHGLSALLALAGSGQQVQGGGRPIRKAISFEQGGGRGRVWRWGRGGGGLRALPKGVAHVVTLAGPGQGNRRMHAGGRPRGVACMLSSFDRRAVPRLCFVGRRTPTPCVCCHSASTAGCGGAAGGLGGGVHGEQLLLMMMSRGRWRCHCGHQPGPIRRPSISVVRSCCFGS